jgi:hypothetical protein
MERLEQEFTEQEREQERERQELLEPKVYWSLVGHDKEGNAIIKVYANQTHLQVQVDKAEEDRAKKQKRKETVTLTEAERFDRLIASLINDEVTKVIPNKQKNNIAIDYAKIDNYSSNSGKGSSTKKTTVVKQTMITITEEGEW